MVAHVQEESVEVIVREAARVVNVVQHVDQPHVVIDPELVVKKDDYLLLHR